MNEYFKKYTGGIALMLSVLFLLIGAVHYDSILTSFNTDIAKSSRFIKTSLFQNNSSKGIEKRVFSIEGNGEMIQTIIDNNNYSAYHYRALLVPELKGDYNSTPKLTIETIDKDVKKMSVVNIYKIDREKGIIYFLLKIEKNQELIMSNTYTGAYEVELLQ